jgi:hypothetical protein
MATGESVSEFGYRLALKSPFSSNAIQWPILHGAAPQGKAYQALPSRRVDRNT